MLLTIIGLMMVGCSTHKNTSRSRFWQSFTAKYNTYHNGAMAFKDGTAEKEKGNKDNYTEMLPLYTVGNKQSRSLGKGNFDRAIEKSEKAIKQHSIKVKPEWNKSRRKTDKDKEWLGRKEYNPFLWKAWRLLGMSQFQKGDFDEALATFSYMSRLYQTQPMQLGIARSWLARCYMELDWLYDAEDVIRKTGRDSIHYKAQNEWDYTYANYYVKTGDYEKAVPYLRKAIKHERRKTQRARMWYLLAQIETELGHRQEAYRAYQKVVRQNPPYILEFNARIAQTEVMAQSNAKQMIGKLKRMARNENNKDYLDQVYYAIGNIYLAQNDTTKAIAAYETGNEKATRSGIEKGVLLLKLGDLYWEMEKYSDAQRCYGVAIGLLDKDRPDYEELSNRSKVLDELVPYTDAVHLQDSLQELAKMSEEDRNKAIDFVIEELKKKEKEERDKAREAEVEAALQKQEAQGMGNRNQTNLPQTPTMAGNQQSGEWYFYNTMAVNQGKQQFQRLWGKRENTDDWQRSNRTVVPPNADMTSPDADEEVTDSLEMAVDGELPADSLAGGEEKAETDSASLDPHNREYYLAQIPFTEEQVEASNLIIMDGLFHSGVIFKDKLDNLRLSEKQLLRITNQYPTFTQMDEVWYHLFLLYSRLGDTETANACLSHMQADYPESELTILLSDPNFFENARFGAHIEDSLYAATYDAFKDSRYDEIKVNAKLSAERFPLGENRPKFLFIEGLSRLNEGDAPGCVELLKQVVEKYPQSEVTELAGMIIKGVQEGRTLYGGSFDLDDIWSRRDFSLQQDSTSTDTLSAERNTNFLFILAYQPDSLDYRPGRTPTENEHQLLYEVARYNFSNFPVRNFDISIERQQGIDRMTISGFLNFDEALQYARQIYADESMKPYLRPCRSLVISQHNLSLIGTRYSYRDYDEFYERTFQPLQISEEELLQIPEAIEHEKEKEGEPVQPADDDEFGPVQRQRNNNVDDFDEDFF